MDAFQLGKFISGFLSCQRLFMDVYSDSGHAFVIIACDIMVLILMATDDPSEECVHFWNTLKENDLQLLRPLSDFNFGECKLSAEDKTIYDPAFLRIVDCFRSRYMEEPSTLSRVLMEDVERVDEGPMCQGLATALALRSYCAWYWWTAHWPEPEGQVMYWAWAYALEMKYGIPDKKFQPARG
jgi:hypothetical protein